MKDRIRNEIKEYLVKWKNYPDSDSNWVPEQDFQNVQCLEDYNEMKLTNKVDKQINSITLGQQSNRLPHVYRPFPLTQLILFF